MRALVILLAVAVTATASAGCGDGSHPSSRPATLSKPEYEARLQTILHRLGATLRKQTMAISRAPDARLATLHVKRLRLQLLAGAAQLATLAPPPSAREPQRQLVRGLRQLAGRVAALNKPAANTPRPLAAFASAIAATEGIRTINDALRKYRERGYRLTSRG